MTDTPARDFLQPRLDALLAAAASDGIARDVAVAVLIDLVTGPGYNDTPLDPKDDTAPGRPARPDVVTPGEVNDLQLADMQLYDRRGTVLPGHDSVRHAAERGGLMGRPPK